MTENSGFETPLLNEHMLLGAILENGEKGFASKAVVYGDGTAERDALRDGCGVADLSYLRMMLIGGDAAEPFFSATVACELPAVGECRFGAILAGDAAVIATPLVVRTGDHEFLLLEGQDRWPAMDAWLRWVADLEQDGVRPYAGVSVSEVTGSLVPLLLHGPTAGEVLGDYLKGNGGLPQGGICSQALLDERIPAIIVCPGFSKEPSYLAFVPNKNAVVIWRSLMSFGSVAPVGSSAVEGLAGRTLGWARLMRGADRVTLPTEALYRWDLARKSGGFIGARSLEV